MANKLRNKTARVSFFAFQDMITTVTGVLIIVMIMLALDLTEQASGAAGTTRANLAREIEQARREMDSNRAKLLALQSELRASEKRVFMIPERDTSGKEVVMVVVSATNGLVSRFGAGSQKEFEFNNGGGFEKVLNTFDARKDRLVFYVRPSGIANFELCTNLALSRSFSIGYDAADEDSQYILAPH